MPAGRWEPDASAARRLVDFLATLPGVTVTVRASVAIALAVTLSVTVIAMKL